MMKNQSFHRIVLGLLLLTACPIGAVAQNSNTTQRNNPSAARGDYRARGRVVDSYGELSTAVKVKAVGRMHAAHRPRRHIELRVVTPEDVLEFSYIGMKTVTRKAGTGTLSVLLEEDTKKLGDVVVTGMQKLERRLFTGSTVTVDAAEA